MLDACDGARPRSRPLGMIEARRLKARESGTTVSIVEAAAEIVARRVEKGLPARITDPATLGRIASLLDSAVADERGAA